LRPVEVDGLVDDEVMALTAEKMFSAKAAQPRGGKVF
jgi:hypothetical protein